MSGRWLANRLAAALAGTVAVGVLATIYTVVVRNLTCGPTCTSTEFTPRGTHCLAYSSNCGDVFANLMGAGLIYVVTAVVLGLGPGFIALTMTPAKRRPWLALPVLVIGTLVGYIVCDAFASKYPGNWNPVVPWLMLLAFPSATGLASAFLLGRIPPFGPSTSSG